MIISKIFVAALLTTAVGASAQDAGFDLQPMQKMETDGNTFNANMDTNFTPPADKSPKTVTINKIRLSGVTGTVQIKTGGGIMTVKAGEPIPEIPSGAEIVVVSGEVKVTVYETTVLAGAGDSFTVTVTGGGVSVGVTGGLVSVAGADGKAKNVAKGESVTLAVAAAPSKQPDAQAKTEEKKPADENPESIPAETGDPTVSATLTSNPAQESAETCDDTVSPSAPCP